MNHTPFPFTGAHLYDEVDWKPQRGVAKAQVFYRELSVKNRLSC